MTRDSLVSFVFPVIRQKLLQVFIIPRLLVIRHLAYHIDKPADEGHAWLRRMPEFDNAEKVRGTKKSKVEIWAGAVGPVRELPPGWGLENAARCGQ